MTHAPTAPGTASLRASIAAAVAGSFGGVDGRDDDGVPVTTRGVFLQVVKDCLVHEVATTEGRRATHRVDARRIRAIATTARGVRNAHDAILLPHPNF